MMSGALRKYLINDDMKKINFSFEIEDLLPSASYKFQLYSMNENGNSSFLSVLVSIELKGVSSQSVSITDDTVYIMNNALGQVICTLYGNCNSIVWFLSSIQAPVATAFVEFSCSNATSGYYQTCDYQNHQYTLYFTGSTNLHGQTIRCSGEGCSPQQNVSDTVTISIIVPVPSVSIEGISGQQITITAGQSKSITRVTGASRPISRILWYIGLTNVTSLSTETQISSRELFYARSILTFIPTKSQNGLHVNCKAYNTDNNIVELTTKPILNMQYGPDQVILSPSSLEYIVNETYQFGPIKCSATCKPPCNYKWIIPNQDVIAGDTLLINSIQRTQSGTYRCQAYNTLGTKNSSGISIIVHCVKDIKDVQVDDRIPRQEEEVGKRNETDVYNGIVTEDANEIDSTTDKYTLSYETLQTPNDQQTYEQIKLEDKTTTTVTERNMYVNTETC